MAENGSDHDEVEGLHENPFAMKNQRSRTTYRHHKGIRVTEFTGKNNFSLWKGEVRDALVNEDLIEALETEKPEELTDREWRLMNLRACGCIRDCLCPSIKYRFQREESASELWNKLEEKYAKKTLQNKLYLTRKLFRLDMKPGVSLEYHIADFTKLCEDLLNMDEVIPDTYKALCLLNSLPDEYEYICDLLMKGKEELDCNEIETELLNHAFRREDKKEQKRSGASSSEALMVRGRQKEKSSASRRKSRSSSRHKSKYENTGDKYDKKSGPYHTRGLKKNQCASCLQEGHWAKDCPGNLEKDKKGYSRVNVTKETSDSDCSLVITSEVCSTTACEWILDSGCSYHCCPNKEWFVNYTPLKTGVVLLGDDSACRTEGIGSIRMRMYDGMVRELTNVRHVPSLKKNLISLSVLEKKGYKIVLENGGVRVLNGALVIMKGTRESMLYYLNGSTITGNCATSEEKEAKELEMTKLWHMRLAHAGEKAIHILVREGLLKGASLAKLDFCEHCVKGKQTRVSFGTAIHNTKGVLDYIHTDVWGPSKNASWGGNHYFITFVDDYSRRVWVYPMKHKSEVYDIFVRWKILVENQMGKKIKTIRSDNGGEYTSKAFSSFCSREGIARHYTVRETPQQNGVAERMNRTLLEKVRCMLSNSGLGKVFWAEAIVYASHLINRLPSSALKGKTPMEIWSGTPAYDYDKLKVFGCPAWYHVKDDKLDPRSQEAIFVGYKGGVKGYKL